MEEKKNEIILFENQGVKLEVNLKDETVWLNLEQMAELFKTFGDPTRIRILSALARQEMCVCDIAELLGMSQSAISHQLRVLKQMELVKYRREGKTVFYSLADSHVSTILAQGLDHVCE